MAAEDVAAKRTRALALHLQGASYQQIADALGYAGKSGAHAAVREALADRGPSSELVEAYQVEAARIDLLVAALSPAVRSGDVQAIDRYLKVIERRTALAALILGAEPVVEDENVRTTPLDELNARRAARGSTAAGKGVPKVAAKRG